MTHSPARLFVSELLGTALLLAVVVGSGIMGERLSDGNDAIALLANALATGAALMVLITIFGQVSGAHFNPAVTLVILLSRQITLQRASGYMIAQLLGAVLGVYAAHIMFGEPVFQLSTKIRAGYPQVFSEVIATFGLILTILGVHRIRPESVPMCVALYITAAYWFTASTSFANPAVTIARSLSNTFAGIAPESTPYFIIAQVLGAVLAWRFSRWLFTNTA